MKFINRFLFLLLSHHCHIFVTVTFPCISGIIQVQISHPGTSSERREQELSFDTKLDEISGFNVEDIGSFKSVRIYLTDPVNGGMVWYDKVPTLTTTSR